MKWVGLNLLKFSPRIRPQFVVGVNDDLQANVTEDVWPVGGAYNFLAAPSSLEIVSSSANDTLAGTGARVVMVRGLDEDYDEQPALGASEITVNLNGTTPVALPGTWMRVNEAIVALSGSNQGNVGNVDVRVAGGGAIVARIRPGAGISQHAVRTVPRGHRYMLEHGFFSLYKTTGTVVGRLELSFRPYLSNTWICASIVGLTNIGSTSQFANPRIVIPLSERTDYKISAQCDTNGTALSTSIGGLIVAN